MLNPEVCPVPIWTACLPLARCRMNLPQDGHRRFSNIQKPTESPPSMVVSALSKKFSRQCGHFMAQILYTSQSPPTKSSAGFYKRGCQEKTLSPWPERGIVL